MEVTYEWNCKTVDVHPTEGSEKEVVYNVHWIVTGVSDELDPDGNAYQSTSIGTQVVPLDPESQFIPFNELTNEIVVGWTKDTMGEEQVEAIESVVKESIDKKINPTSVTMTIAD